MKSVLYFIKQLLLWFLLVWTPVGLHAACNPNLELLHGAGNTNGAINTSSWSPLNTWGDTNPAYGGVYTRSYQGNTYLYVAAKATNGAIYQGFATDVGCSYTVSAKAVGTDVNQDQIFYPGASFITIESATPTLNTGSSLATSQQVTGGTEQDISFTFTATSTTTYIALRSTQAYRYANFRSLSVKANVGGGGGTPATQDKINNVNAPATVALGSTASIDVDYSATQTRELVVALQLNRSPWTSWNETVITVGPGTGTQNFQIPVPSNIAAGNGYQFHIRLQPVGGNSGNRLDAAYPQVTLTTGGGGGGTGGGTNNNTICNYAAANGGSGAIKPLCITWEDNDPTFYHYINGFVNDNTDPKQSPLTARIQTITFYDPQHKVVRTISGAHFKTPDTYRFNSPVTKTIYHTNNGNLQYFTVSPGGNPTWNALARAAFSDKNLNRYVGGNRPNGVQDTPYPNRPPNNTVRHLLSYTGGFKVGNGGDGYVIISERGGNNDFYIVAHDLSGHELGHIFVRRTPAGTCSSDNRPKDPSSGSWFDGRNNPNVDYFPSGRMQENPQEICVAVYPIQKLAPPGSTIGSIEMWAASEDPGDGKVMLISFLDEPQLCYDYSVTLDGIVLDAPDRQLSLYKNGDGNLSVNVAIRSLEGDVTLTESKIKVRFVPDQNLSYTGAKYSPNTSNILIPAIPTNNPREIAIGEGADQNGGTIRANERYFTQFHYTMQDAVYQGKFDIDMNVTSNPTGLNPIFYYLSTKDNTLTRCPQSSTYNPDRGMFNVERIDSGNYNPVTQQNQRFPLFTQIAGKPFSYSVVAYSGSNNFANEQHVAQDYVVDLELINAKAFDDNTSFFKCQNTDPGIIQTLPNGKTHHLIKIPSGQSRVDLLTQNVKVGTDNALRQAAFRLWVYVDSNGDVVPHNCTDPAQNGCFSAVYQNHLADLDTLGRCTSACSGAGSSGCYQCLRNYLSVPICSRDDFAVRPQSYLIETYDTNESTDPTKITPANKIGDNTASQIQQLAAGYDYGLRIKATRYGDSSGTQAGGYFAYLGSAPDASSQLLFDRTTGTGCKDDRNVTVPVKFADGYAQYKAVSADAIDPSKALQFSHNNVGKYNLRLYDNDWTLVDQSRYTNKTFPGTDDCLVGSNAIAATDTQRNGCVTQSTDNAQYTQDLAVRLHPYAFNVSSVAIATRPVASRYLFMTDFTKYSRTAPIDMSADLNGTVSAIAKDGTVTTNFTSRCAANDVNILVETNNTMGTSPATAFQYAYKQTTGEDNTTYDINVTMARSDFADTLEGNASLSIATTIKKLYKNDLKASEKTGLNPVTVTYERLRGVGYSDTSHSHKQTSYTPQGENLYDQNITFFYGRIFPLESSYTASSTDQTSLNTPLYAAIYCDLTTTCSGAYGLNDGVPSDTAASANWKLANIFNNNTPTMLGNVTLKTKSNNVELNTTNSRFDANATLSLTVTNKDQNGNEVQDRIGYYGPVYLLYEGNISASDTTGISNDTGLIEGFDVSFPSSATSIWTGFGKTGKVVGNSNDNQDDLNTRKTRRLEW